MIQSANGHLLLSNPIYYPTLNWNSLFVLGKCSVCLAIISLMQSQNLQPFRGISLIYFNHLQALADDDGVSKNPKSATVCT